MSLAADVALIHRLAGLLTSGRWAPVSIEDDSHRSSAAVAEGSFLFVHRVLYFLGDRVEPALLMCAIRVLDRYAVRLHPSRFHSVACAVPVCLLFYAALTLMVKAFGEVTERASYYASVAGIAPEDLMDLELQVAFGCDWCLVPSEAEMAHYANLVFGCNGA